MLNKNEEAASSASKPPKTPEELAEIAYLDKLRSGEGEERPERMPLACIVKVVGYEEVPKANDKYAMVTVHGPEGRKWRMCIYRYYLEEGMNALFVSDEAAMPQEDRFNNRAAARVKLRAYKFGFGVKEYRYLPVVSRNIYHHNTGILYALDDFPELRGDEPGTLCAEKLHIDHIEVVRQRAQLPKQPKAKRVFVPPKPDPVKKLDRFMDKVRRHRERFFGSP